MKRSVTFLATLALAATLSAPGASAHPVQHDAPDGHLHGAGAQGDIQLVSKVDFGELRGAEIPDLVADVGVDPDGDYAYLANWGEASCADNAESNGPDAGAWVVDISNPAAPEAVGFIETAQDSAPGEGVQALHVSTKFFTGDILVLNNEQCGPNGKGGVSLFDVTNPLTPRKLVLNAGDKNKADANDSHSAFAWQDGPNAYAVIVDNIETTDVDILDITNPANPKQILDLNVNTFVPEGVDQQAIGLQESSLHDMIVKEIDGHFILLLSYWDGGYVLLNVDDPANPVFLGDTQYANPDPELFESAGLEEWPEGNGHQAEFTADNEFFIATDEDFSPYRANFDITTGDHAGTYPAGEFGFTPPLAKRVGDQVINGPTVFAGYGCTVDHQDAVPPASEAIPTVDPGEERIAVFQRGPVQDPSHNHEACFFSEKIEAGQNAGYDAVIVANHHNGAQGGRAGDAHFCGGQGHDFDEQKPAFCIGHRQMHFLFNSPESYALPYDNSAEPAEGTVGAEIKITPEFDGWGYVHLFDADLASGTPADLDTFAIDEAHNEAFASGFGDLSVHEVATDPQDPRHAYLSYYSGGIRSIEIRCEDANDKSTCDLVETGSYLDPQGNDFWGVEAYVGPDGETYVLGSDRDSGLWIFKPNP
jgi:hypothetical protein